MKRKAKWGEWMLVGVLLVMMVRLGRNVWRLWRAGDRIKQAGLEVRSQELENQELKKRLAQVQSPEFIEKEVREKLGLGKEGEQIVVTPVVPVMPVVPVTEEPNWRKWWKLYVN